MTKDIKGNQQSTGTGKLSPIGVPGQKPGKWGDSPRPPKSEFFGCGAKDNRIASCSHEPVPVPTAIVPQLQGGTANTVPGPASIAELARALNNNVDLIFQYVYNNIEFHPTYGLQKGGLGTLISGNGNAFDQSDLMVQLLKQLDIWLIMSSAPLILTVADERLAGRRGPGYQTFLSDAGFPAQEYTEWDELVDSVQPLLGSGQHRRHDCMFDPTIKAHQNDNRRESCDSDGL